MTSKDELACTYSALILADDDVPITVSRHPHGYYATFSVLGLIIWCLLFIYAHLFMHTHFQIKVAHSSSL